MSCFCKTSATALLSPALSVPQEQARAVQESPVAQSITATDARLTSGNPGLREAWREHPMPQSPVPATTAATVATLAQLQAQAREQCGIDLAQPRGSVAMIRLIATVEARLQQAPALAELDLSPWTQLADLNEAAQRVTQAAQSTAQVPQEAPHPLAAVEAPADWAPFTENLQSMSMLTTAAQQMNAPLNDPERFAFAARSMANVTLPQLPSAQVMLLCQLSLGLAAVARLAARLGVNPAEAGYRQVRDRVAENVQQAQRALTSATAQRPVPEEPVPGLPRFATLPVMRAVAAQDPAAVRALQLDVQLSASTATALAVSAFVANVSIALRLPPATSPCRICDAQAAVAALTTLSV